MSPFYRKKGDIHQFWAKKNKAGVMEKNGVKYCTELCALSHRGRLISPSMRAGRETRYVCQVKESPEP